MKSLLKWIIIVAVIVGLLSIVGWLFSDESALTSSDEATPVAYSTPRPTAKPAPTEPKATPKVAATPQSPQPTNQAIEDTGDFTYSYTKPKSKKLRDIASSLEEDQLLETLSSELNQTLILPKNIQLTTAQCDEENAYYNSDDSSITLCYELIDYFYNLFGQKTKNQDKLDDQVINAVLFTFFHELGHALIDVYQLPVIGREEDAADQLSTFLLTDGTKEGDQVALDGAQWFYLSAQESEVDDSSFSDEHSLDKQRFYNIMCWTYGQKPSVHQDLLKKNYLPQERADQCEAEYQQLAHSWGTLLAPYIK